MGEGYKKLTRNRTDRLVFEGNKVPLEVGWVQGGGGGPYATRGNFSS